MTIDTARLVERLRSDAAQLLRMSEAATFGKDVGVRVKDPSLLLADLNEAIEALTAQAAVPDMERTPDEEITPEVWSFVQSQFVRPTTDRSFYTFVALLVTRHRVQLSAMQERLEKAERERDAALRIKEMSSKALAFEKQLVRADAANARVAELEAAVGPFCFTGMSWRHGDTVTISVKIADIYAARAALHQQDGGKDA